MRDSIKPVIRIGRTSAAIQDDGITYNETGISYNESSYAYGGLYGNDFAPAIARATNIAPNIRFGMDFSGTAVAHGQRILGAGMLIGMLGMTYPTAGTVTF